MKNNWLTIALIALLTTAAVFLWDTPPEMLIPTSEQPDTPKLFPYAMIKDAHSKYFDEQGELSYEFVARSLHHYRLELDRISPGDFTSMAAPKLTLYSDEEPWFVTARQGRISQQGEVLTLWDSVRIWQPQDGQEGTELITERLVIEPNNKIITSAEPVSITSPQGRLEAVGIMVDLNTKHIKLLDRVRGVHDPI